MSSADNTAAVQAGKKLFNANFVYANCFDVKAGLHKVFIRKSFFAQEFFNVNFVECKKFFT